MNASSKIDEYKNLRTIPGMLSIAFGLATLFTFGGIPAVELSWLNYTLTPDHSVLVSLGVYVVAFASSETKELRSYDDAEKALIALAPALLVMSYLGIFVPTVVADFGTTGEIVMYVATLAGWGVAVQ